MAKVKSVCVLHLRDAFNTREFSRLVLEVVVKLECVHGDRVDFNEARDVNGNLKIRLVFVFVYLDVKLYDKGKEDRAQGK